MKQPQLSLLGTSPNQRHIINNSDNDALITNCNGRSVTVNIINIGNCKHGEMGEDVRAILLFRGYLLPSLLRLHLDELGSMG